MIEIFCNNSPFVFKPILQLLDVVNFSPNNIKEGMIYYLMNPFNSAFECYKVQSHLTDSQNKDEQIRYLGNSEIEKKLIHLSLELKETLDGELIVFKISPYFEPHRLFRFFIKHLKQQVDCEVLFSFEKNEGTPYQMNPISNKLENLMHSSDAKRIENAAFIYDAAKTCINVTDYYSAINLLLSIRQLFSNNELFETNILCELAVCHGAIGELKEANFYWNVVFQKGNLNQKNCAAYALGLMYLRHLPKQFQNLELGESYLNDIYVELMGDNTSNKTQNTIDKVFNRNGYALAQFKKGKLEKAEAIVSEGIETLEEIGTDLSIFHQSVLYYNLAQCYKAKGEHIKVEQTLKKLIEIDQRFCLYHEYLIAFYLANDFLDKSLEAIENGLNVDNSHLAFHFLKGKTYYQQGDNHKALKQFERAYELNESDSGTLAYLTSIHCSFENFETVIDLLSSFQFKFCNNSNGELIVNNLVVALLNTSEDEDSVVKLIESCIHLSPESEIFNNIIGMLNLNCAV